MLNNVLILLEAAPLVYSFILGLLVGSFLNVVILRLPRQLQYEWTEQCKIWLSDSGNTHTNKSNDNQETAEPEPNSEEKTPPPGVVKEGSHCPKCNAAIKPWHNIPVLSYIVLGGKCANCKTRISVRYPLIELFTAGLSALVIHHFGISAQGGFALLLTWALVALTFIDFDHQLLPDNIVLPFLWLGLLLSLFPIFANPNDAIIGAVAGYMSLWLVFQLFKLITGKEGMGFGDFKLLALFGAWLGWQMLPQIIFISTLLGSIIGISLMALKIIKRDKPIPFGPYISTAGFIALLWGEEINQLYLSSLF